jgi:hypothetical protein
MWPRYSKKDIIRDKCIISEMTSNSFAVCDQLFFPEFLELSSYASARFTALYPRVDSGTDLDKL